jgi:hypothetical protein
VFPVRYELNAYIHIYCIAWLSQLRVEEGRATPIALGVVREEEKEKPMPGGNWANMFLGDTCTGTSPPHWGIVKLEVVRFGHESSGIWTHE